jgi:hypothetical protein
LGGENWPGPWDLIAVGKYDNLAIALGMSYTLLLSNHGKDHTFDIVRMQDPDNLEVYNLAIIDEGKYVLNFTYNEVISKKQLGENLVSTHHMARLSHNF